MTEHRQRGDPVQLAHAQQHASAQARRLAFDDVQFAARLGHRVHQLKHAQIRVLRRGADSAARRRREPSAKRGNRKKRSGTTPQEQPHHPIRPARRHSTSRTRTSKAAADKIRHHHSSHGRAASQGPPSAQSTNRSIAAPRSASKRPSRISVCRNSRCGASSIAACCLRLISSGDAGSKSQSRKTRIPIGVLARFRKWNSEACPNRSRSSAVGSVLRRHGDRRLGQRRPIAMQPSDRLLVDLSQQAVAQPLAADVFVVLHRRDETAKCNAAGRSTTAARARCSSPAQTGPRRRRRLPRAGSSPSVPDLRTASPPRRIALRVGRTTSQSTLQSSWWMPYSLTGTPWKSRHPRAARARLQSPGPAHLSVMEHLACKSVAENKGASSAENRKTLLKSANRKAVQ